MGPTTSDYILEFDGLTEIYSGYDKYCYYQRVAVTYFSPRKANLVRISQDKNIPNISLEKGDDYQGPRIGYIGGLLLSSSS
jgi:hypothetical protein